MTFRKSHSFRHVNYIAALVVAALIAASCGSDDTAVPEPATPTDTATTTQPVAPDTTTSVQEPDTDAGTDTTVEIDAPSETTTTVVETTDTIAPDESPTSTTAAEQTTTSTVDDAPTSTIAADDIEEAREDAIDAIIAVFEDAAGEGNPYSFEECRQKFASGMGNLTGEEVGACIGPLAAVLEACNQLDCAELGLTPEPTTVDPPATTTTTTTTTATPSTTTTTEPPTTTTTTEPPATTSTASPTTTTEPPPTTTTTEPPTTTTTVPEEDAEPSETVTLATGWVVFPEGYLPPVHPDTPTPSWIQGTWELGEGPDAQIRVTAAVQAWIDWCGTYRGCEPLLEDMWRPLDFLGADEVCVLKQYEERAIRASQPGVTDGYNNAGLTNRFGWHRCASVIDPMQPDGRLLSEHGLTMAQRCRAVLPDGTELETHRYFGQPPRDGLDCDEWGEWAEGRSTGFEDCDRSARLAEEWMEHYHNMPHRFPGIYC